MALTEKIINKVSKKTDKTDIKPDDMLKVLSEVEQGRQTKRTIERILRDNFR